MPRVNGVLHRQVLVEAFLKTGLAICTCLVWRDRVRGGHSHSSQKRDNIGDRCHPSGGKRAPTPGMKNVLRVVLVLGDTWYVAPVEGRCARWVMRRLNILHRKARNDLKSR